MVCNKCGSIIFDEKTFCPFCGNQINIDFQNGVKRFHLCFTRKKQRFPFLSSFPYITPRLFINDELAYTFTKCEDIEFYFEKDMYKIDIVTFFGHGGAHFFIEIKEDTAIEFYFSFRLGIITRITFS